MEQATTRRAADSFKGAFAELIAQRALVGWTTGGHTAVDVNLHAFGPGSERFVGHFDIADIGRMIAVLMGFDLQALTQDLQVAAQ